jgi:molybdopterin-guanine dinucleotide biosynthesis protein A
MNIEGAVLVGGESRRMGANKSELLLDGRRIVDRLCDALRPLTPRVRLVGGSKPEATAPDVEHQPDLFPGLGPLAGIHTALATARGDAVLVVGCDLPFVTSDFLRGLALAAKADPDADAVVPWPLDGPVPVCALYRARCLDRALARLERRELEATAFVHSLAVRWLRPDELRHLDPSGRCLFNMNRPSDYEKAKAMATNDDSTS